MGQVIVRNAAVLIGIALCVLICAMAAPFLTSPRGAPGPTVLQAESIVRAAAAVLVCFAAGTLIAAVIGRIVNPVVGLFVLGTGLFALAGRLETVEEFAHANAGAAPAKPLTMLGVETLLWAALTLGGVLAVLRLAGPLRDVAPDPQGRRPHPILSPEALRGAAAGVLVLPVMWLLAQSPMKGQMIGAAVVGSMIAGLAARLFSPHVQPVLAFVSPIMFGGLAHLIGAWLLKRPLDAAYVSDSVPALLRPMPIDYAAGSLMGAAMGIGWAKSFLAHEDDPSGHEKVEAAVHPSISKWSAEGRPLSPPN